MKKVSFVPWENTGMEILKKPPLKKPHVYIKFSICAVFALAYCVLMFFAFYNAERYTSAVPLELEAKIVRVERMSTEDSDSYDAIMRYVHEGVAYEAVYDSFNREKDAQALIGQSVIVAVDTTNPGDTLDSLRDLAISMLGFSCIPVFFLAFAPSVPHRKTYVETYGWCVEAIKKDIPALPKYGMMRMLIWVAGCFVMYFCFPTVFSAYGWKNVIFGIFAISVIVGAVGAVLFVRDCLLAKAGRISFHCDSFVSKCVRSDSESGDSYYVNFTNGTNIFEKSVSAAVYEKMKEGDVVESAYLGNQKKPVLCFYHNEEVIS